jgi:hypothetical protein
MITLVHLLGYGETIAIHMCSFMHIWWEEKAWLIRESIITQNLDGVDIELREHNHFGYFGIKTFGIFIHLIWSCDLVVGMGLLWKRA